MDHSSWVSGGASVMMIKDDWPLIIRGYIDTGAICGDKTAIREGKKMGLCNRQLKERSAVSATIKDPGEVISMERFPSGLETRYLPLSATD
ncbi:hypothetical protein RRG08_020205 [Elysia crispata]|uniref:Uncharacterized protein n=1 Tax=Elysia crispata TaxID=231223 RepID=A0AAE1A2G0_9GAST|nr:hypothetical protein RRG08_020205 [Elysia crispata]